MVGEVFQSQEDVSADFSIPPQVILTTSAVTSYQVVYSKDVIAVLIMIVMTMERIINII